MATAAETNWRNAGIATIVVVIALFALALWWGAFTPADSPVAQAPQPELVAPQSQPETTAPQPEPQPVQPQ